MANPHAATPEVFATESATEIVAEGHGAGAHLPEPELLGFEPFQWVAIAMLVLLLIAFLKGKVHKTIAGGLDNKIATIRQQLEEAKSLRAEAEALRAEYAAKIAGAEKDAESMIANAHKEAEAIVSKAEADTKAMIARREQMAKDKIGAEERKAVDELRARAAAAATAASARIIAEKHDAAADRKLADETIAAL